MHNGNVKLKGLWGLDHYLTKAIFEIQPWEWVDKQISVTNGFLGLREID